MSKNISALIGRLIIGGVFLYSGITSLIGLEGFTAATAQKLPYPEVLALVAIAIKILGGLLLILGVWVEWAAFALLVFTVLATGLYHTDFSDFTQVLFFQKNLMIMGGLFLVFALGSGKYNLYKLFR